MKNFVFLLLFILLAGHLNGQGIIKGNIVHKKQPLQHCFIVIENTNLGAESASDGTFIIQNVPLGTYDVAISLIGYRTFRKKIQVISEQSVEIKVEMEEEVETKEEVVVTGTMKESFASKSPIKVDILTPQLFKKNPTPTIFEALQMVNGVQPQLNCNVCNTGDIHINGMEGPYTMITIDGMPIVSALGTVYGLSGIPNSLVKRIEVVKGPASTLYGSEAVGGLVNIITKDPASTPKAYIDLMSTSQQEYNVDVALKTGYKKLTVLTGINYFNFKNRLDVNNDNFTDVTLQNRISVFNKFNLSRKENRVNTIGLRYLYEDRFGGEMQWNKSVRGSDSIYGESIYTSRWELIGTYQLPVNENIRFQYSLTSHHQNSVYGKVLYKGMQNIIFTQLIWNKNLGARHDLLVGLPFRYTFYDDNTVGTEVGDSISGKKNNPQNTLLPGIFVQDEYNVSEKLLLLGGIRYDYNSDHGNIVTPRIAAKYDFNKNNSFRLGIGNGYRVVNLFTEDHAALTGARKVVIQEGLSPETSWNINTTYNNYINHSYGFIGLEGGLFYTYFSNKIIGDFLTDPNYIFYNNLKGYAVSKGVIINVDLAFNNSLKAIVGVTLMDVYSYDPDVKGKIPQLHAPKTSGTFAISYTIPKMDILIDYTGRVTGPMNLPVVPNDYRPSMSPWFSIQNIQFTKKFKFGLELYGGAKNILNFIPKHALLRPFDPFDKKAFKSDGTPATDNPYGYTFDPTYMYAPIQGRRLFIGLRYSLN